MKTQINMAINDTSSALHVNLITVHSTDLLQMQYLFFYAKREEIFMPRNQFQRMIFALLTVIVTVHAYVFYSLYVVNGSYFSSIEGAAGVLDGIRLNGGVMMLGRFCPIWAVILV